MDVSIIIVNYNTCKVTQDCIDSIFEYTKNINFEVILVDNNSKDQSKSIFSKDQRITYLYQDNNWGFGKANNIGLEHSKGKYIFLLNSDTLLRSNAIKEFFDFMENSSNKIACTGTILKDINENIIHSYGNFPSIWTGLCHFTLLGSIVKYLPTSIYPRKINKIVDYITGADLFIRKNVALRYGLFDSDFFMYYEETELQYRYMKNGYKSVIFDTPQIIHLENYSVNKFTNKNRLKKILIFFTSYCLYLKKTTGYFSYVLFKLLYSLICITWLLNYKYTLKERFYYIKTTLSI